MIRNVFWILAVCLCVLHQIFQHGLGNRWWLADAYLDAFLSMPIVLGLMLQERQMMINLFVDEGIGKHYRFSGLQTIITGILLAIVFEEFLPRCFEGYTRDYWDYGAYALGIIAFHFLINKTKDTKLPTIRKH